MEWIFRKDRPIYTQLVEHLQGGVLTGEYPPGSVIPSVRLLAEQAEVNPNTMQRAFAELDGQGLFHTHRTMGRTVTEDESMIEKLRENKMRIHIGEFFEDMKAIGIDARAAAKFITAAAKNTDNTDAAAGTEVM